MSTNGEAPTDTAAAVASRWDEKLDTRDAFSPRVYWLAVARVWQHYRRRLTGGDHYGSFADYCLGEHLAGGLPVDRMLSIGCGDGELERGLAKLGAFRRCDAWDISPASIATARRRAREEGYDHITYAVHDVNVAPIAEAAYHVVYFHSSLHHLEALEEVCERVAAALAPGGWLFFEEFVGPSRFVLTERQKEVIRAAFALIPPRLRVRWDGAAPAPAYAPAIPDPVAVAAADPSESIRSAEILEVVGHYFDIVDLRKSGGTLLQFLLHNIAGSFRQDEPDSMRVLDLLMAIEDTLIDIGDLGSDFVGVAARPKSPPPPPLPRRRAAPLPVPEAPQPSPPPPDAQPDTQALLTELANLRAEKEDLAVSLRQIRGSRTWRLANSYWRLRRGVAHLLGG